MKKVAILILLLAGMACCPCHKRYDFIAGQLHKIDNYQDQLAEGKIDAAEYNGFIRDIDRLMEIKGLSCEDRLWLIRAALIIQKNKKLSYESNAADGVVTDLDSAKIQAILQAIEIINWENGDTLLPAIYENEAPPETIYYSPEDIIVNYGGIGWEIRKH